MVINKKEYSLVFDNRALFEFGELCGAETYSDIVDIFREFDKVGTGSNISIDVAFKLAKLGFICLKVGNESLDLTERDVFNYMVKDQAFSVEVLDTVRSSFNTSYPENEGVTQEEGIEKKK
jgi:hypothetical protein